MRTKHLLSATALVALLAACSNEDFISNGQQDLANDGRPTVSDVKLNFTKDGVDTRLSFGGGGYAWEGNETIGALLMDNLKGAGKPSDGDAWVNKTWLERYELTSTIHTDYPFTYDATTEEWSSNTKMLEGNYFFAFPWDGYAGNRQVKHSLINQTQTGVAGSVVASSYAKNQFFVGYSQIKAGVEAKDALTDVKMTAVLGAIQLRIKNTGTQEYHINKVVLSGDGLLSALTFDPTDAEYKDKANNSFNLTSGKSFNYANYTNNQTDLDASAGTSYVYNADKGTDYDRKTALRAVVSGYPDTNNEKYAQLVINGTAAERVLTPGGKKIAYALIMANAQETVATGKLMLSIYTDEGLVKDIDLTKVNAEITTGGKEGTAITDALVAKVGPEESNTITVQIDDNSFAAPTEMTVQNSDDLLQFVKWNVNAAKGGANRVATATLAKNITFTKEMADLLKTTPKCELTIKSATTATEVLTIAADVDADLLSYANLKIGDGAAATTNNVPVTILGTINLTEKKVADVFINKLTVEKGAILNISKAKTVIPVAIINNGTLDIAADAQIAAAATVTITNNSVMNVLAGADVKATVANKIAKAQLNVAGYMEGTITNAKEAKILMGETGTLKGTVTNNGIITTVSGAKVIDTTNTGADAIIEYVSGATVTASGNGKVTMVPGATLTADNMKEANLNSVNTLLISGATSATADVTITSIDMFTGGNLSVATGKSVTVTTLTVKKDNAAVVGAKSTIKATSVVVEKGATLTNNGAISGVAVFTNEGLVENNGSVVLNNSVSISGTGGVWKFNAATNAGAPVVPVESVDVTIGSGSATNEYATLKALQDAVTAGTVTVKSITISSAVALTSEVAPALFSDNHFSYLKTLAAGKEVKLGAVLSGLTQAMSMSFGKLTVTADATVSGDTNQPGVTILTVASLDYTAAKLTVTDGYIQLTGSGQIGLGSTSIKGVIGNLIVTGGKVVTSKTGTPGELVKWDGVTNKWAML